MMRLVKLWVADSSLTGGSGGGGSYESQPTVARPDYY
jgi:hypothetical protein